MRIKTFLLTGIAVALFVSCEHKEVPDKIININESGENEPQNIFKKVKFTLLKNNGNVFMPDVSALDVYDDYMLIRDKRDILYLFTRDGNLISDSEDKFGHGDGEFSIVTAYTFNPYSKTVEIVTPKDLLIFDIHFKLQKKIPIPTKFSSTENGFVFFGKIFDLDSKTHLLIPTGISKDCNRIYIFDSEKHKMIKTISYEKDVIANITMQTRCFFPYHKDSLLFFPPCITNNIFTFDKRKLSIDKKYHVDFGSNGVSVSDIKQYGDNVGKLKEYLLKCDKSMPVKVMYANHMIVFLIKESNNIKKWHTIFYCMNTGLLSSIKNYDGNKMKFPPVFSCWGNSVFSAVEAEHIPNIQSMFGANAEMSGFECDYGENNYVVVEYPIE